MSERPYHHGNLRAALLTAAERTLREEGLDQVSAHTGRAAGVSHAAPRRHFPDRPALLDALAAVGYERLADTLTAAMEQGSALDFGAQFRAAGTAFVRFAVDNAALLDLMFARRPASAKGAPERPYLIVGDMVGLGQESPACSAPGDPGHLRLLVVAMFQGIAELITSPAGCRLSRPRTWLPRPRRSLSAADRVPAGKAS